MEKAFIIQGLCLIFAGIMVYLVYHRNEFIKSLPKDPVDMVYDAIDHAIKINQPKLSLNVTKFSDETFLAMFRGIRSQGISLDVRRIDDKDILVIDLEKYQGPRNQKLEKIMDYGNPLLNEARKAQRKKKVLEKKTTKPSRGIFSIKTKEPARVISLDEYRKKKQSNSGRVS